MDEEHLLIDLEEKRSHIWTNSRELGIHVLADTNHTRPDHPYYLVSLKTGDWIAGEPRFFPTPNEKHLKWIGKLHAKGEK